MTTSIDATYGALLLGGFCAAVLSGVVGAQTVTYMNLFPQDSAKFKAIVGAVWTLDTIHSVLVDVSLWIYLITNFGNVMMMDSIPIPLALSGIITAILTFIVHCLFAYRIHKLDRLNWRFTALVLVLAFLRLCCASVTTTEMIRLKTFTALKANVRWVYTLGLAMSCLVDVLVTGCLIYSLRSLQGDKRAWMSISLDRVIDTVILYTFETNILTSTVAIVSMICWLTMPNNFVFLGLHFFISKLYANVLLVTLNARKHFQHQRQLVPTDFPRLSGISPKVMGKALSRNEPPTKLGINGVKMVKFVGETPSPSQSVMELSLVQSPLE